MPRHEERVVIIRVRGIDMDALSIIYQKLSVTYCKSFNGIHVLKTISNLSYNEVNKCTNFYQLRWIGDKSN